MEYTYKVPDKVPEMYPKELVYSEATPEDVLYVKGNNYSNLDMLIAIPTRGMIPAKAVVGWKMMMTPLNSNITHAMLEGMEVGYARNYAAKSVLNMTIPCEFLFFLDDDVIVPPDILIKLTRLCTQEGYDVVSGLYHMKNETRAPLAYRFQNGIMQSISRDEELSEKVLDVDVVPMGCTLIKKSLIQKLKEPYFQTLERLEANGDALITEDTYFCVKAKEVGAKIGVHTGIRCGHINTRTGVIY